MNSINHQSVLLSEVLEYLDLSKRRLIVDATLGLGGHTEALLNHPSFNGTVIGIDQDQQHLQWAKDRLVQFKDRFLPFHMNFSELKERFRDKGISFDGILFDLGVASPHFDDPDRGFSFHELGPLDMRMDVESNSRTAADILNAESEYELYRLFRDLGEEPLARAIAKQVVRVREEKPFRTTIQLSELIVSTYRARRRKSARHPAARVFQALRIAVNKELEVLKQALHDAIELIEPGGRILVISYHSLEDRMVKQTFKQAENPCLCPPKHPICTCGKEPQLRILTKKPLVPSDTEIDMNPRARSAKMRVAEKLATYDVEAS